MQPNLNMVIDQVGRDKNIERDVLVQALEQAILTAAKKTFGPNRELEAQYNRMQELEAGRVMPGHMLQVLEPERPDQHRFDSDGSVIARRRSTRGTRCGQRRSRRAGW